MQLEGKYLTLSTDQLPDARHVERRPPDDRSGVLSLVFTLAGTAANLFPRCSPSTST